MNTAHYGDRVTMHVTGKLKGGEIIASTQRKEPITCTLGDNKLLPCLENAVIGMQPGESKTQAVSESDGFGPYNDDLLLKVNRASMPSDIQPKVGMEIDVSRSDGPKNRMRIKKIADDYIVLDANHPLAGKDLIFDIQLLNVDKKREGDS